MLIKKKEIIAEDIQQLTELLAQDLTFQQKFLVERELRILQAPLKAELSPIHFLNFYYKDSPDWALIHDLRIEENGFSARFDHLLINRRFNIYLIGSRNFYNGLRITPEGDFLAYDGRRYQPIPSPIDECQKHSQTLEEILNERHITPKRMGMSLKPKIKPYILVSPLCEVSRPPESIFDSSMVVTADYLAKTLTKQTGKMHRFIKNLSRFSQKLKNDPLVKVACKLASLHKSSRVDYAEKFDLNHKSFRSPIESVRIDNKIVGDYCI
jgi:hypothetical protein